MDEETCVLALQTGGKERPFYKLLDPKTTPLVSRVSVLDSWPAVGR